MINCGFENYFSVLYSLYVKLKYRDSRLAFFRKEESGQKNTDFTPRKVESENESDS